MAKLCTLDQVKDRIGIGGAKDDPKIEDLIEIAADVIMRRYGREFVGQVSATIRTFAVRKEIVEFTPYDLRSATTVKLHPEDASPQTLVSGTDYTLLPIGGDRATGTYTELKLASTLNLNSEFARNFGVAQLEITGNWGIWASETTVNADVRSAAIETVLSWLNRPVADVTGYAAGEPRQAQPAIQSGWDIPLSAHRKLMPYSRNLGVY